MRHDTVTVGGDFHPRCHRDILHLRSAFPLERLNRREVQLFLAGQALSLIYTPTHTIFCEKSGLDPFCGCGTTVDAAQRLERQWIGIDITYIAVDLITKRLRHNYGDNIIETFQVNGIPRDLASASALFAQSAFDFERWAVSLIGAEPNQKQVGDKGIDGVARFPMGTKGQLGRVLVSVKGGKISIRVWFAISAAPSMLRRPQWV
jgi:SAM-dependent methyltransferase